MEQNRIVTVEAMKKIEQRWAAAKDTEGLMTSYADDAMFDIIGAEPVVGKDAIRAHHQAGKDAGDSTPDDRATAENREAVVLGDWGYTSGDWRVEHSYGRVDSGTYLNVVKLVDGEAKLFRQIGSVDKSGTPTGGSVEDTPTGENVVTVEAMKELEQRWLAADSAASKANLYAEDAIFDNINEQPLMGKDAIQAHYDGPVEIGASTFDDREAVVMGNWGYTSGIFTYRGKNGFFQAHFLHVFKPVGGELKMLRHIFGVCDGECPD